MHDWLPLSEGEQALVAAAASFARERIAPNAADWERGRQPLPRDVFRQWAALGLNAMEVSPAAGGRGASFHCRIAVAETVARTCLPSAFALINAHGGAVRIEREGSADQVARLLPRLVAAEAICAPSFSEPGAGSDFAAITSLAERCAGGWRLTGEKAWVTNGAHAEYAVMAAQTEPGARGDGIASFIVDLNAAGVERRPPYALMGGHAIGASAIRLDDVFVPDADLFAPPSQAFKRALIAITTARVHAAAMACGIVAGALARAVGYAQERRSFGTPLIEHQGLRWSLADVATELEAARGLVARAAGQIARGADATLAAAQAKSFAAGMALRGVAACMQAMGAVGLREDEPFGRHLAAARIVAYVDGTTEIQRDRIGRLLGRHYAALD